MIVRRIGMRALIALVFVLHTGTVFAREHAGLHQAFLDLTHDGVLMNLAAHPDDEDGASLAYYRMKHGVRTYSVFFTRGEGGQNERGPELYQELGVLRTEETKAASILQGTEPIFLNLYDFGYSKTATETFHKWGGQTEVLRRLVLVIRRYKPDVIFTNHNTVDGHGHHQAVGITAIAAFDAAADSTLFPEQLREPGVHLWQPRKLFFRVFGRDAQSADVINAIQDTNQVLGVPYVEIAIRALQMHKTQGMDRVALERFVRRPSTHRLVRSNSLYDRDSTTFFSGVDLRSDPALKSYAWARTAMDGLDAGMPRDTLLARIASLLGGFETERGTGEKPALAQRVLRHWQQKLERLVQLVCGITLSVDLEDPVVVPRQRVACALRLSVTDGRLGLVRFQIALPEGWTLQERPGAAPVTGGRRYERDYLLTVGDRPALTLPKTVEQYRTLETNQRMTVYAVYTVDGYRLTASADASFEVAPPHVLTMTPRVVHLSPSRYGRGKTFGFAVRNYFPHKTAGVVALKSPKGWKADLPSFAIGEEDSTGRGTLTVRPPEGVSPGRYVLRFRTDYATDSVRANIFDVAVADNLNLGIVKSYDNTLEAASDELGIRYTLLGEEELRSGDLSRFHTIVVDIRAYLVRADLQKHNGRLLDYVAAGGHLVVMYQRDQEWKADYAPFPFEITRRRVTVEEAPVDMLIPDHPLLNHPNRISAGDWEGWIQERGVYFPGAGAERYLQLLSTHDPDEPPLTTGYLVTSIGRGSYIYTSFVWYRQLKEMNPGAFRCFANMISYPFHRRQ